MISLKTFLTCLIFGVLMTVFLTACGSEQTNENDTGNGKIQVVATIAQIGEPIAIIGGDYVQVESLMGPGVDPHLYVATQGDINTLQNADIIFYSGLHLEGKMGEIFANLKKSKTTFGLGESIDEERLLKG